ncbi:MAG: hypothetical protein II877_09655 [Synergistaceae bacterium]|nr:hypothetical protein [Synergistaceae bacterium]
MSGAGQVTQNPGQPGYLWLGEKSKPLDCRTNLSSTSEQGQEMSVANGKERGNLERVYTAKTYTFYVAGIIIMKRTIVLAALVALAITATAFAQDFGAFTMDIPAGWSASVNGPTGIAIKDDKSASLSVTIMPAQGNSAKTFADAFAEEFKGSFAVVTTPEADADGSYSWTMTSAEGVTSTAMLGVEDDKCKLIVITGLEAAGGEIADMLQSIKEK